MLRYFQLLLVIIFVGLSAVSSRDSKSSDTPADREGKLLSLFQIVRRERGNCRICYATVMESDFMTSGMATKMAIAKPSSCCGYGTAGTGTNFDCVIIPGALNPAMLSMQGMFSQFSDRQPFNIRFLSDAFEGDMEILMGVMSGFKLTYLQTSNGCNN
eukprot:TCALIF_13449-PA protein Name:"Protein of unknown function" AED:0.29 eAED:0.39 QI:1/0/0.2/0.4/0.75/0.8/5/208/157